MQHSDPLLEQIMNNLDRIEKTQEDEKMRCGNLDCNGYHLRIKEGKNDCQLLRCDRCGRWYESLLREITPAQAKSF